MRDQYTDLLTQQLRQSNPNANLHSCPVTHYNWSYCISSPISLVIFVVPGTEILEISHEKCSSSYSQGFGIQKQFMNLVSLIFFADNMSSVGRSLTFRVSAYR